MDPSNFANLEFVGHLPLQHFHHLFHPPNTHAASNTTTGPMNSDINTPASTAMDSESERPQSPPSSDTIDLDLNSLRPAMVDLNTIKLPFTADNMVAILSTLISKVHQLENEKSQLERDKSALADNSALQHEISHLRSANTSFKETILHLQQEKSQTPLKPLKPQNTTINWDHEIDKALLHQEHTSLKEKAIQLEKEKRKLQDANSQLEKIKSELKQLNLQFEGNNIAQNKAHLRLRETYLKLEESECRLLDENSKLREENSQLREKFQDMQESTAVLEAYHSAGSRLRGGE